VGSKAMVYDVGPFMKSCVDPYRKVVGGNVVLRHASTPFLEETAALKAEDEEGTGLLQPNAAKLLMKMLYGARVCRLDLLKAIGDLSTRITKWSTACDRRLHRLVSYINRTIDTVLVGWVGDSKADLFLKLFVDADFAGD